MKVVVLAGGVGNRLAGDTHIGPKPMIEIGGHPLLWHILRHYSHFGYDEFVIAVGYQGAIIKRYFADFRMNENDVRFDMSSGSAEILGDAAEEKWLVDVIDTGRWTETAGRILRLAPHMGDAPFMLTFGDAVADVDLNSLLAFHRSHGRAATLTAVHPSPRFGELVLQGDRVSEFSEKPMESGWTNGGYMVMEPSVFEYIEGDSEPLSPGPLERLADSGQLAAYEHVGFWRGVDVLRDKTQLERMWEQGEAPWAIWNR
jgi:glucose-1-phosphate cytidylyltransferase